MSFSKTDLDLLDEPHGWYLLRCRHCQQYYVLSLLRAYTAGPGQQVILDSLKVDGYKPTGSPSVVAEWKEGLRRAMLKDLKAYRLRSEIDAWLGPGDVLGKPSGKTSERK